MTKADLIYDIERHTKQPKEVVSQIVEAFMASVQRNMLQGEDVHLRGFGSFLLKKRAEKTARIVKSNIEIKVPEHYLATFKIAKEFKIKVKAEVKGTNKEASKASRNETK
jgi:DNA-binding protein HU-beta